VSERAQLLVLLHRVRRRVRGLAAVDGAVRGGAVGLGATAIALGWARLRGGGAGDLGWHALAVLTAAGLVAGALARALRPISLIQCARYVDGALDRQERVLSALSFAADGDPPAALGRAALADAVTRARALAPAVVAPLGRPRGLPALAVAALAAVLVAALPSRAPASRAGGAPVRAAGLTPPRLRVDAKRLDAERDEARRAAEAALTMGDERLGALARDLAAALRSLSDGTLTRGEALDRLQSLAARAAEASGEAESQRRGLRAAGQAMEDTPATRSAGAAMTAEDPSALEQALSALAQRAGETSNGERAQIASALQAAADAAAASGAGTPGAQGDGAAGLGDGQRRLAREHDGKQAEASSGAPRADESERHLQRLRRDLADTASACREDPDLCRRRLADRARDLPRMERESMSSEARKRLESAIRQMRERLRRGDLGDRTPRLADRRAGRDGHGQSGKPGSGERRARGSGDGDGHEQDEENAGLGDDSGDGDGAETLVETDSEEGDGDGVGDEGGGQGQRGAGASASGATAGVGGGQGEGIGTAHVPDALGRTGGTPPPEGRGHETEARLKGGGGPSRAQVIEAAAERGFARGGYDRVYSDYQSAVEEALTAGDVPEGRRYVVRRYFQLIRPRATKSKP
jgi:hypothetical protein